MGCGSCGSGGCSTGGCGRNGGCATGGCNKLNTFDWLGNMLSPKESERNNIYEVRFKNTRKGFYRNVHGLRLYLGDPVVVESDRGYDTGYLSLGGVAARLQLKKKKIDKNPEEFPRIYRKANENDLEMLKMVRDREAATRSRAREIIADMKLDMKLSDVEFQGDNAKAIFYYIADHRVDFRELIKVLAREFRIRVEMKQIGLRHEAGLVGGIGSCGRELCCSTWLTEFKTVSTSAARYQNLSLNPMKISGLCGRLKCCLNYELDAYMDALADFPKIDHLTTRKGKAFLQKTDIFKRIMWFSYESETTWYSLSVDEVIHIHKLNQKGEKIDALSGRSDASSVEGGVKEKIDFVDVVGQNTFKPSRDNRSNSNKKRGKRGKPSQGQGQNSGGRNKAQGQKRGNENRTSRPQNSRNKEGNPGKPQGERRGANTNNSNNSNRNTSGKPANANNQGGTRRSGGGRKKTGPPKNRRGPAKKN